MHDAGAGLLEAHRACIDVLRGIEDQDTASDGDGGGRFGVL